MAEAKKRPARGKPKAKADGRSKKGKYQEWLTEEGLLKIGAWARNGLTLADIAHNIGISLSTLNVWREKYAELEVALKQAREVADIRVENALYKRAVGYSYVEKTTEEGPKGVTVRTVTKEVPPDVTAQIYWLKNRRPDVWRDKQPENSGGEHDVCIKMDSKVEELSQ